MKNSVLLVMLLLLASFNVNAQINVGNPSVTGAVDSYAASIVVDKTNIYTNTSGGPQEITLSTFNFYAHASGANPITPFVTRVEDLATGDYTVMVIGTTRANTEYTVDATNSFNFHDTETKSFILGNGLSIAVGYMDGAPDGTGSGVSSVITYNGGGDAYYTGSPGAATSGSIAEGEPIPEADWTSLAIGRTYSFSMDIDTEAAPQSAENDILNFNIGISQDGDAVIDNVNHTVVVEAAYGTDASSLTAVFEVSPFATPSPGSSVSNDFSSPATYVVTAENGDDQNWTVTVNVSTQEIPVTGISVDPADTAVNHGETVQINYAMEPINASNRLVEWSSSDETIATVDANGLVSGVKKGSAIITATSDDGGFEADCSVEVVVAGIVYDTADWYDGMEFKIGDTIQIGITYEAGAGDLSKDVWYNLDIVDETGASVSSRLRRTNAWGKPGNDASFGVRASSATLHYDLSESGGDALEPSVDLPAGQEYVFSLAYDREIGSNIDINSFRVSRSFVLVDAYSSNDITAFSFTEQTGDAIIDADNHTVDIEVEYGSPIGSLVPTIKVSENAGINPNSGIAQDFSSDFNYIVIAENGDEQEWVVSVSEAPYVPKTGNDITAFSFAEETGNAAIDSDNHTVEMEVEYSADLNSLVPTIEVSDSAKITPASGVAQDFSSDFKYTVTAENGDEQEWTITVTKELPSTENDITAFSFAEETDDATIDTDNYTVNIEVENGTELNGLVPTIEVSDDATINPASGVAQDFSSDFKYTVKAENGDEQEWTISVSVASALGIDYVFEEQGIYPNPAVNEIHIQGIAPSVKNVIIVNMRGAVHVKSVINGTVDISNLVPGMYLVKISKNEVLRFIKQ